jgi:hypothetical protein
MKRRITITPAGEARRGKDRPRFSLVDPYVIEGDFEFEVEELDSFVQVSLPTEYAGGVYRWTYSDPSGSLKIGDVVQVPVGHDDRPAIGTVVEHGRGFWNGETKDVTARLVREEL